MKSISYLVTAGRIALAAATLLTLGSAGSALADHNVPPDGFIALFNGKDLAGWWGAKTEDPREYMALPPEQLAEKKTASLEDIRQHWRVENGELINDGGGLYLTTDEFFGDFELLASYKLVPGADSGIYLRGTPQVSIWDARDETKLKHGADKGSGGLWNNPPDAPGKDPLVFADNPVGEWDSLRVIMTGERVSVWLNGKLVVDHARLYNHYNKKKPEAEHRPLPLAGPIQLQTHGGGLVWRDLFLRKIDNEEANQILASKNDEGFESVFNGKDFTGWRGETENYQVADGAIVCQPEKGGTIFTEGQYGNFVSRLEFQLPPGGNNGLAIRYPGEGHGTWDSFCELQVLDDGDPKYNDPKHPQFYDLKPQQAHGSVYARIPAHRGYLRPPGEWNFQESTIDGSRVKVELNGFVILETDVSQADPAGFMYEIEKFKGKDLTKGHFGFNGHNDPVRFRAIRIRQLE